jgi:hypothetical protein
MAHFLLVRPSYDDVTTTLHSWADEVHASIQSANHHVCSDLSGDRAVRSNTESHLTQPCDCFIFYGHATEDSLAPHGGLPTYPAILDMTNSHLLSQKLVYTVSCKSARRLGQDAVSRGCRAYMGYRRNFKYVANSTVEGWFKRVANAALLHLLTSPQNPSCDAALARAKREYDVAYNHFKRGEGALDPNRVIAYSFLSWNRASLDLIGDRNMRLS